MDPPADLVAQLAQYKQSHLLAHFKTLSAAQKSQLLSDLAALDLALVAAAYEKTKQATSSQQDVITACALVGKAEIDTDGWTWKRRAHRCVSEGRLAAVCLAGGQGTRLGFDGPKGAYDAGFPSGKSLFQLHAERIRRLQVLAGGGVVPWYVMTSPLNDAETKAHFEERAYFGLDPAHVVFFSQGTLPCLHEDGKIMLENEHHVAAAPDGNGGVFAALAKSGALDDMAHRGVLYVHMYAVDNPLASPGDALFVGCCVAKGVQTGNMCVPKSTWKERVGVAAMRNGAFHVVEYSEITEELAQRTNDDGSLAFGSANICSHFFTVAFIRDVVVPGM